MIFHFATPGGVLSYNTLFLSGHDVLDTVDSSCSSSSEDGMDAYLIPPTAQLEFGESQGVDGHDEVEERDFCSFYVTAETLNILETDDVSRDLVAKELRDCMDAFQELLEPAADEPLSLAANSAFIVDSVMTRTGLPLARREHSLHDCLAREGRFSKYSEMQEAALCRMYFHEVEGGERRSVDDVGVRSAIVPGTRFEVWLRHHCIEVVGGESDPKSIVLAWNTLNLLQTAILCAWDNFFTLYLLASLVDDGELMRWFDGTGADVASRAEVVLAEGANCLVVPMSCNVSCVE